MKSSENENKYISEACNGCEMENAMLSCQICIIRLINQGSKNPVVAS